MTLAVQILLPVLTVRLTTHRDLAETTIHDKERSSDGYIKYLTKSEADHEKPVRLAETIQAALNASQVRDSAQVPAGGCSTQHPMSTNRPLVA